MKTHALLLAAGLVLVSPLPAAAEEPTTPLPLADQLAAAQAQARPLLVEVGAVWCEPCKKLAEELAKPEHKPLMDHFLVAHYDGERGEGQKLSLRYQISSFPTLLILDGKGDELTRLSGFGPGTIKWLELWKQVDVEARARTGDLPAAWAMVERALAAHDVAARRRWLALIVAHDRAPEAPDAAKATWQLTQLDARAAVVKAVRPYVLAYIDRHPTQPYPLALLATLDVDQRTIDADFARAVKQAKGADKLTSLVYRALEAKANDAALVAAQRALDLAPNDPHAMDSLAEVLHVRGESARAIALQTKAVSLDKDATSLALLTSNLERFRRAQREPSPQLAPPKLSRWLFANEGAPRRYYAPTAEGAAGNLFWHAAASVAKMCGKEAPPGIDKVYVRLHVGAAPHAEKIELLEPRATPKLRQCVETMFNAIDVPPGSAPADTVVWLTIKPPAEPPPPVDD